MENNLYKAKLFFISVHRLTRISVVGVSTLKIKMVSEEFFLQNTYLYTNNVSNKEIYCS